ncbi:MAG: zinc ribbon domain-containing protein [Clostridiales Family XIII bacterium]|nr:zinc ribbon domain-containing protein [Clostridiales Family XIII bacterium]
MVGESGTSRTGQVHRYYKCASVKNHKGCTRPAVKKGNIENIVVHHVKNIVFSNEMISRIADMLMLVERQESDALPLLEKQMKETEKAIGNMPNAIQQGIYGESTQETRSRRIRTPREPCPRICQRHIRL